MCRESRPGGHGNASNASVTHVVTHRNPVLVGMVTQVTHFISKGAYIENLHTPVVRLLYTHTHNPEKALLALPLRQGRKKKRYQKRYQALPVTHKA